MILGTRKKLLDHGEIWLKSFMGSDKEIANIARVSTGKDKIIKTLDDDKRLIEYLYINKHTSPFEFAEFIFYIKCPIFVQRQIVRHRTASMNEVSARYKKFEWECHLPNILRLQSQTNKQGSSEERINSRVQNRLIGRYDESNEYAKNIYNEMLEQDVTKEQARGVMPVAQYTEFYWKIDYHNLLHFLSLRMDKHAQYETRVYANAIFEILMSLDAEYEYSGSKAFPYSLAIFKEVEEINKLIKKAIMNDRKNKGNYDKLKNYLKSYLEK